MLEATEKEKSITKAEQEEYEAAFAGPAVLSNRFFVTASDSGMRIAFLEQHSSAKVTSSFRTAVTISFQDAVGLYKLLQHVLLDVGQDSEEEKENQ